MTIDDYLERLGRYGFPVLYLIAIIEIVYGAMFCDFVLLAIGTFALGMAIALRSKPEETGEKE